MHAHAHAKLTALCLPLALTAALQGGSCGGGRESANAANAAAVNARANAGANAERPAGGDSAMGRSVERVAKGAWGGPHISLTVTDGGAEAEFDCAHGRVGRILPDAEGRFDVEGTLVPERGGPVRPGQEEQSLPARYSGRVEGKRMTLTVAASSADEDSEPVTYTLTHGGEARLFKCR